MKTLLLLVAMLATSGCYRIRYVTDSNAAASPTWEKRTFNVALGLAEMSDPVAVEAVCPVQVASVTSEHGFVDNLIWAVSLGGWTPNTVSVTCSRRDADPAKSPFRPWP